MVQGDKDGLVDFLQILKVNRRINKLKDEINSE